MNKKQMGSVAQTRRLLNDIGKLIGLVSDEKFLKGVPYKSIQPIEADLRHAFLATQVILHRLGDNERRELPEPRQKTEEHRGW